MCRLELISVFDQHPRSIEHAVGAVHLICTDDDPSIVKFVNSTTSCCCQMLVPTTGDVPGQVIAGSYACHAYTLVESDLRRSLTRYHLLGVWFSLPTDILSLLKAYMPIQACCRVSTKETIPDRQCLAQNIVSGPASVVGRSACRCTTAAPRPSATGFYTVSQVGAMHTLAVQYKREEETERIAEKQIERRRSTTSDGTWDPYRHYRQYVQPHVASIQPFRFTFDGSTRVTFDIASIMCHAVPMTTYVYAPNVTKGLVL